MMTGSHAMTVTTTARSSGLKLPPTTLVRWCKFNLVGGIGIGVQLSALFLLKRILHFNYLAAAAIAVEVAVVHNFIWHERFTWADRINLDRTGSWRRSLSRLARFNLTNGAVSILGNVALLEVMVGLGRMNYLVSNAIAIALCSLANFLVSETWVFQAPAVVSNARREGGDFKKEPVRG